MAVPLMLITIQCVRNPDESTYIKISPQNAPNAYRSTLILGRIL